MFLGENLLALLVLAMGGALAFGNLMALVRPPEKPNAEDDLEEAPLVRTIIMIIVGCIAAGWSLLSLFAG